MTIRAGKAVPGRVLRIVSECETQTEFVSVFRNLCDKDGIFVASRAPEPRGSEFAFRLTLNDGTPMMGGTGRVSEAHLGSDNRWGRSGMRIDYLVLDDASRGVADFLSSKTASNGTTEEDSPATQLPPPSGSLPPPVRGKAPANTPASAFAEETTEVNAPSFAGENYTRECKIFEETGMTQLNADPSTLTTLPPWWSEVDHAEGERDGPTDLAQPHVAGDTRPPNHSVPLAEEPRPPQEGAAALAPHAPPPKEPSAALAPSSAIASQGNASVSQPVHSLAPAATGIAAPSASGKRRGLVLVAAIVALASGVAAYLVLLNRDTPDNTDVSARHESDEPSAVEDPVATTPDDADDSDAPDDGDDSDAPDDGDDSDAPDDADDSDAPDDADDSDTPDDGDDSDAPDDGDATDTPDDTGGEKPAIAATLDPDSSSCRVALTSTPSEADVFFGAKKLGETPTRASIPCGTRTLLFRRRRYREEKIEISTDPAKTTRVKAKLVRPRHTLRVVSTPSKATVYVRGKKAGKTPLTVRVPGFQKADVKVKKSGYRSWSKKIRMTKERVTVKAKLKKR